MLPLQISRFTFRAIGFYHNRSGFVVCCCCNNSVELLNNWACHVEIYIFYDVSFYIAFRWLIARYSGRWKNFADTHRWRDKRIHECDRILIKLQSILKLKRRYGAGVKKREKNRWRSMKGWFCHSIHNETKAMNSRINNWTISRSVEWCSESRLALRQK
jgi:ribosomal protein L34E